MSAKQIPVDRHFRFGQNWQDFLRVFDERRLEEAQVGLRRLFPEGLDQRSFLDIGSGSGLSALAALRMGASVVTAIDIDPESVAATERLLSEQAPDSTWTASEESVFDLAPGTHDVVYSWGVLHHTGAMWQAVRCATAAVNDHGQLAVAIYRRTPLCYLWLLEKRFYSSAPSAVQSLIRAIYKGAYVVGLLATKRNPASYVRDYGRNRGMSFDHDVHDWLCGYPFEYASPDEMRDHLTELGFSMTACFENPPRLRGLLGTACDEYVFVRTTS